MPASPRLALLAAASVLLLTATSLACKPTGTAPPAAASAPIAKSDPAPSRIFWTASCSASGATACSSEQPPVCGQKADLTRTTFADACAACRAPGVLYYSPGACDDEPSASS